MGLQLPQHRNSPPTEDQYSARRPYFERNVNNQTSLPQNTTAKQEWQRKYINGSEPVNKPSEEQPAGREMEFWN